MSNTENYGHITLGLGDVPSRLPALDWSAIPLLDAYDRGIARGVDLVASTHCTIVDGNCVTCANGAILLGANPSIPLPDDYKQASQINNLTWKWREAHGWSAAHVFNAIERFNDQTVQQQSYGPLNSRGEFVDVVRQFIIESGFATVPVFPLALVEVQRPWANGGIVPAPRPYSYV